MAAPRTEIKPFDALSLSQLHACLRLRAEVFVVDQRICVEADPDASDPLCHHAMCRLGSSLVGTARLRVTIDNNADTDIHTDAAGGQATVKVGRVAVHRDHRRQGHGSAMMHAIQDWIAEVPGRTGVMSAQAHLEAWYAKLGWLRAGEAYTEAGIPHVRMRYRPPSG